MGRRKNDRFCDAYRVRYTIKVLEERIRQRIRKQMVMAHVAHSLAKLAVPSRATAAQVALCQILLEAILPLVSVTPAIT